ncbi:MAG TPA: glycosyltransferase [Fimbriimonadaceae bacterium]|nr:glycosyltransferase [Fimbriimonadaceae bacterium]HRE93550.1 glycosyltransferase [Fimbriimonadaceae bacterium]
MKILHVIRSADPKEGGPIEGILQRGQRLQELGHEVTVVALDGPNPAYADGFPLNLVSLGPGQGIYGHCADLAPWLVAHSDEFDFISGHGIWQQGVASMGSGLKNSRTPYVVWTHGMLDPWFDENKLKRLKKMIYWPRFLAPVLERAHAVMFTTEEERRLAKNRFRPYRFRQQVVAYGTRGIVGDADAMRAAFLQEFPELQGKRVLLFLSRVHPKKGCDLLVRAFGEVYGQNPDVMLVVAGPDQVNWIETLRSEAQAAGVADRIVWPGMLKGERKWGAFAAAEAFVLPSHQENFGIVVAEALSAGKPTLISDKVNIWREVIAAKAGVVAPDTQAGATQLLRDWESLGAEGREAMSQQARPCFEEHFSVEGSVRDFLAVAEAAIKAKK